MNGETQKGILLYKEKHLQLLLHDQVFFVIPRLFGQLLANPSPFARYPAALSQH